MARSILRLVWNRLGCGWRRIAFLSVAVVATMYGGAKHTGSITYPRTDPETWYLLNNGSYVTNDAVHLGFTRNVMVPTSANFFVDGLELKYTNQSDWATHSFNAYSNTFDGMNVPFDMAWPSATNYNWIAYTDWTPAPVVHTNGVAFVVWQVGADKPKNVIAITRTGVYENDVRIAPNPSITNGPSESVSASLLQELANEIE